MQNQWNNLSPFYEPSYFVYYYYRSKASTHTFVTTYLVAFNSTGPYNILINFLVSGHHVRLTIANTQQKRLDHLTSRLAV